MTKTVCFRCNSTTEFWMEQSTGEDWDHELCHECKVLFKDGKRRSDQGLGEGFCENIHHYVCHERGHGKHSVGCPFWEEQ